MSCPMAGLSRDVSAPYLVVKVDWSIVVFIPTINVAQLGPSDSELWMGCLIPNSLRICNISFTGF